MNGISHERARRYIQASADDLLNVNDRHLLEEHLQDCGACRAYAAQLGQIESKFQQAFHTRWDGRPGPAHLSVPYIQSKGRRIAMGHHFLSGVKVTATVVALIMLTLAALYIITLRQGNPIFSIPAQGGDSRPLIAFASDQSGNGEIYTIGTDGSGLTDLTDNPAEDGYPAWSPDGKQIAFTSDRNGVVNIFVMDADGGNVRQLTDNPAKTIAPSWSPDGKRIAFVTGDWEHMILSIYVMDSDGGNKQAIIEDLTSPYTNIIFNMWSPDGQWIADYIYPQIVKIGVGSKLVKPITPIDAPEVPDDFAWTADGKIVYLTGCPGVAYCYGIHSIQADGSNDTLIARWQVTHACPEDQTAVGQWFKWSADGSRILLMYTCGVTGSMFIGKTDGSDIQRLTNYSILGQPILGDVMTGDWSPDNQTIAFYSAIDPSQGVGLYTINVEAALNDPSLKPTFLTGNIIRHSFLMYPVWQPRP